MSCNNYYIVKLAVRQRPSSFLFPPSSVRGRAPPSSGVPTPPFLLPPFLLPPSFVRSRAPPSSGVPTLRLLRCAVAPLFPPGVPTPFPRPLSFVRGRALPKSPFLGGFRGSLIFHFSFFTRRVQQTLRDPFVIPSYCALRIFTPQRYAFFLKWQSFVTTLVPGCHEFRKKSLGTQPVRCYFF